MRPARRRSLALPGIVRRASTREHSARASAALVLGLLGACGLFVVAPAALTLALLELQAIADGAAPIGGRGLARAGVVLGAAGVLMPLSAALVWFLARSV